MLNHSYQPRGSTTLSSGAFLFSHARNQRTSKIIPHITHLYSGEGCLWVFLPVIVEHIELLDSFDECGADEESVLGFFVVVLVAAGQDAPEFVDSLSPVGEAMHPLYPAAARFIF
mgnify:CR=1